MQEKANDKFDELKLASNDSWEYLKSGVENALDSIGDELKSVSARLK